MRFDEPGPAYSGFRHDEGLVAAWRAEATAVGRDLPVQGLDEGLAGSTDIANVSLAVPAIHPMLAIETGGAVNLQPGAVSGYGGHRGIAGAGVCHGVAAAG